MAIAKFDGNDKSYLVWMAENPNSFIINTGRSINSTWFVAHRSQCTHITSTTGFTEGAYTERKYIKIASNDLNELQTWFSNHYSKFEGNFKECKTCQPLAKSTTDLNNYFPEVLEGDITLYPEGTKMLITVNAYERNQKARQSCLQHHGYKCKVCELDFEKKYGVIGRGFIHVHHIQEFHRPGIRPDTNPITDLIPVCPNCHAMLHRQNPCFTIEELKSMLLSNN
jgi:5-methylcytosine-specific restriction enzyme A